MFLSEWREFPSTPCLAGKTTWWQLASRCWNRACPWHASELVSFLVGLRTYQHPGILLCCEFYKSCCERTPLVTLEAKVAWSFPTGVPVTARPKSKSRLLMKVCSCLVSQTELHYSSSDQDRKKTWMISQPITRLRHVSYKVDRDVSLCYCEIWICLIWRWQRLANENYVTFSSLSSSVGSA